MASVTFKRGTRAEIEAIAKQDGQILMETDQTNNKMYVDLQNNNRVRIGNSNVDDISGITDSLTATSSNIALSAAGGNNLQGQIDTLNSSLKTTANKIMLSKVQTKSGANSTISLNVTDKLNIFVLRSNGTSYFHALVLAWKTSATTGSYYTIYSDFNDYGSGTFKMVGTGFQVTSTYGYYVDQYELKR